MLVKGAADSFLEAVPFVLMVTHAIPISDFPESIDKDHFAIVATDGLVSFRLTGHLRPLWRFWKDVLICNKIKNGVGYHFRYHFWLSFSCNHVTQERNVLIVTKLCMKKIPDMWRKIPDIWMKLL